MTFDEWWDTTKATATPDTFAGWEASCRQAWNAAAREAEQLRADKAGLIDALRDEMDEGLRLRELGGALPDENITAMTERAIRERSDLALLVGRLIQRMRAAREGRGIAAGDDALEQQAIGYLKRKGLTSPLRESAGEPEAP